MMTATSSLKTMVLLFVMLLPTIIASSNTNSDVMSLVDAESYLRKRVVRIGYIVETFRAF